MPVSLYAGEEEYLLSHAVRKLREQVVNPQLGQLSHKLLEKPSVEAVLEAVGAVSFNLGGQTLIEIREFPHLNKTVEGREEAQLAELQALLETVGDSKHVLFVSGKINRRYRFPKWLSSQKFVDFQSFEKLAFWQTDEAAMAVVRLCREEGISVEPKAVQLLVDNMGVELRPLINELRKLAVYAHNRAVTPKDVMLLSNHNENTFQMLKDWIRNRNRAKVYQTLEELLLHQHPVPLFSVTQSYVSNIFQLRHWQKLGVSQGEMAQMTGKKPFSVKKTLEEFADVPLERLEKLKRSALEFEWKTKTGQLEGRLAFEMLMGV